MANKDEYIRKLAKAKEEVLRLETIIKSFDVEPMTLGETLRCARLNENLTAVELHRMLDRKRFHSRFAAIHRIEQGHGFPKEEGLLTLCEVLGLDFKSLNERRLQEIGEKYNKAA